MRTDRNHLKPFTDFVDPKTMATVTDYARRVRSPIPGPAIFTYMALACMAVAFLARADLTLAAAGVAVVQATPVIHFHGLLFFALDALFRIQAWLAHHPER
jgi:uncharacterized protein (DUF1684 family)